MRQVWIFINVYPSVVYNMYIPIYVCNACAYFRVIRNLQLLYCQRVIAWSHKIYYYCYFPYAYYVLVCTVYISTCIKQCKFS